MKISYSVVTKPSFLLVHPDLPSLIARRAHLFSNPILRIPYTRERFVGLATRSRYSTTERRPSRNPSSSSPPIPGRPGFFEKKSDKAENRARVYEFLRGLGIVPDELDGLELPVTVEVMKERVEFLRTLGLNVEDINNYPLVLGCSVKKNMIPVLDYLGKLGVRKSTFTEFLRRYPQVLHSSVVVDLAPVVKYLQGMDIKPIDVPRVLEAYPEVLGFKLEGTMSTSVAYLVGIGVSRREIGPVLTRYPEILGMRVGRTIKPFVEYLESLGVPRLAAARLIETRPQILGFGLEDRVKPNIKKLIEFRVREGSVASVVARCPEILGLDLGLRLESQRAVLELLVGLSSEGFGRVLEKMPQAVSLAEKAMVKHVEFFRRCGFSPEQLRGMIEACPQILALNLDIAKMSFGYFEAEMGRELEELAGFPAFFTYGLESVVKPRQRVVARKGVKCSLAWMLNCSDEKFKRRIEYDAIDADEMGSEEDESFDMKTFTERRSNESESESECDDDDDDEEEDEYV